MSATEDVLAGRQAKDDRLAIRDGSLQKKPVQGHSAPPTPKTCRNLSATWPQNATELYKACTCAGDSAGCRSGCHVAQQARGMAGRDQMVALIVSV
eukprot:1192000-Amphidinium_carterae.1